MKELGTNLTREDCLRHLERIDRFAVLLDAKFQIPGTRIFFGWESFVGLIPVVGDTLMVLPQSFLIYEAVKLGVDNKTRFLMGVNIVVDWILGSVPLVGDLFDIAFKCNLRNARLIRNFLEKKFREEDEKDVIDVEAL